MNDFNKIEEFIDTGIGSALGEKTSGGFTDKMMREIAMIKEFEKQDRKTFKLMNVIAAAAVSIIIVSGIILAWLLGSGSSEEQQEGIIANLRDGINGFGYKVLGLFGISPTGDVFIYVFIAAVAVSVFAIVDKYVIRRGYN